MTSQATNTRRHRRRRRTDRYRKICRCRRTHSHRMHATCTHEHQPAVLSTHIKTDAHATAAQPRAGARSAAAARCSSSINTPARVRAHARTMWLIARNMRAHPRGAPAEQGRTSEEASEIHRRCHHHHHHHHHNNNSSHGRHHTCHHNLNKKSAQQPSPRTTQGAGARTRPSAARTKRARQTSQARAPACRTAFSALSGTAASMYYQQHSSWPSGPARPPGTRGSLGSRKKRHSPCNLF
jgi:hypothetical protein